MCPGLYDVKLAIYVLHIKFFSFGVLILIKVLMVDLLFYVICLKLRIDVSLSTFTEAMQILLVLFQ